jgi:hypothetical protein
LLEAILREGGDRLGLWMDETRRFYGFESSCMGLS